MAENTHSQTIVCPTTLLCAVPDYVAARESLTTIVGVATLLRIMDHVLGTISTNSRAMLHLGECPSLALAICNILDSKGVKLSVTTSRLQSGLLSLNVPTFVSESTEEWTRHLKSWAPSGVDLVVTFNSDRSILHDVASLLSITGTVMCFGHCSTATFGPPLKSAQRFVNMDLKELILANPGYLQSALCNLDERLDFALNVPTHGVRGECAASPKKNWTNLSKTALYSPPSAQQASETHLRVLNTEVAFDPRRAYVVIGGVGGVGIALARCLIERGARTVILTSRSGSKVCLCLRHAITNADEKSIAGLGCTSFATREDAPALFAYHSGSPR